MAPKDARKNIAAKRWSPHAVWLVLLAIRVVNALTLSTFFQPDEYYQALEPAWAIAFGRGNLEYWKKGALDGPWITWEWENSLRSSLYPMALAAVYKVAGLTGDLSHSPTLRAQLLINAPKIVQAVSAALMDYFTWGLAERVYGRGSLESKATLLLTIFSPWQWYVSTRSFTNCVETTLTAVALYYWPWEWLKASKETSKRNADTNNLRKTMIFAGVASILRPTNLFIWMWLSLFTVAFASQREFSRFIANASIWGSVVLVISMAVDRYYYGETVFPPLNFFAFNLEEGLADFYGINRLDYYFTEGIPLLLTTALPFAISGLIQSLSGSFLALPPDTEGGALHKTVLRSLAFVALILPIVLTFIAHKEARFIYPVLPILLTIAARPLVGFFHPFPNPSNGARKILLGLFLGFNILLAVYVGYFHNRAIIGAMDFIRKEHERANPNLDQLGKETINGTSVGIFMPCHSVPWRSHLVYPGIQAWALTCDPPLGLEGAARESYVDEADKFYDNPKHWMELEFGTQKRRWPDYIIFHEELAPILNSTLVKDTFEEGWRGFNSLWHDDWRRKGDVQVWVKTMDYGGPGRPINPLPRGAATGVEELMKRTLRMQQEMNDGTFDYEAELGK